MAQAPSSGTPRMPVAGPIATVNAPKVQYIEDFFIYELDVDDIVPGGIFNGNVQIQADSDFKLVKLALIADIAGAGQTAATRIIPLCTMQLVDSGSGRQLFSLPVPLGAIFGDGQLPFILPVPRIFKARSNIAVTITNYSAAEEYEIKMALIGNKIFQMGGNG